MPMLKNRNGEADYNLWYHCMASTCSKILVVGSDTDVWVYGMAPIKRDRRIIASSAHTSLKRDRRIFASTTIAIGFSRTLSAK